MTLRVLLVALLLVLFYGPARAEEETLRAISEGAWFGGAYEGKNGRFSHCAVTTFEEGDVSLVIALTANRDVALLLGNDEWKLPAGEIYRIPLSVDGHDLGIFPAQVSLSGNLRIDTAQNAEVFDYLHRGQELVVNAARAMFKFDLDGSAKALDALRDCVDAGGKPAKDVNPFAEKKGQGTASSDLFDGKRYASRVDEMFMILLLLKLAGLENVELVEPVESPFGEVQHGWTSGQLEGAVYAGRVQDVDVDRLAVSQLARQEQDCAGVFTSSTPPPEVIGKRKLKMFSAECRRAGGEGNFFYAATSVDRGDSVTTFISTTRTAPSELQDLNQYIYGWFRRVHSE